MAKYSRSFQAPKQSFFLFGPRGTGKSTWLVQNLKNALYLNLLKSSDYLPLMKNPSLLRDQVLGSESHWIVIDEIQKIPQLLDEVHQILFEFENKYKFALTGSSARKLKKENANMLAGRARYREFFTLTSLELNFDFQIEDILKYGTLPSVRNLPKIVDKIDYLDSYVTTYLREEIAQEALTRNLESFVRFLEVAALMNAQTLNISNISRDVGVARTTVDSYFSILVDTLICSKISGFRLKSKVKETVQAKLYFFDCGIAQAMSGQLRENLSSHQRGFLFETFILNEIKAYNSYSMKGGTISYWSTPNENEVDFIFRDGSKFTGIEVKSSENWLDKWNLGLQTLLDSKKIQKAYGIYCGTRPLKKDAIHILPVIEFCKRLWRGELF
jgi:predicted AAA+ superfamily ATPase